MTSEKIFRETDGPADDFIGHPLRKDYVQELPPVVPRIRKGGR